MGKSTMSMVVLTTYTLMQRYAFVARITAIKSMDSNRTTLADGNTWNHAAGRMMVELNRSKQGVVNRKNTHIYIHKHA